MEKRSKTYKFSSEWGGSIKPGLRLGLMAKWLSLPLLSFVVTYQLSGPFMGSQTTEVKKPQPQAYFDFHQVAPAFKKRRFNLKKIPVYSSHQFLSVLESAIPRSLRKNFKKYAPHALEMAQKYKVDPFWVLSIMWTESHFKHSSVSHVGAHGLMQIMPDTGKWLAYKMTSEKVSDIFLEDSGELKELFGKDSWDPYTNIEVGVYYLKYLKRKFRGNTIYATVAYNMGPGWVWKRIRRKGPIGVKNLYLNKVRRAYHRLSSVYRDHSKGLKLFPRDTLVAHNKKFKNLPLKSERDLAFLLDEHRKIYAPVEGFPYRRTLSLDSRVQVVLNSYQSHKSIL